MIYQRPPSVARTALMEGCSFAMVPVAGRPFDVVSGKFATALASGTIGTQPVASTVVADGANKDAIAVYGGGAGTFGWVANTTGFDAINSSSPWTVFFEGSLRVNTTEQWVISSSEAGLGNGLWITLDDLNRVANGFTVGANNVDGKIASGTLGTNSELFYHRIMISFDPTNGYVVYAKRKQQATGAAFTITANTSRQTKLWGDYSRSAKQAGITTVLVWKRVLPLGAYLALHENPWLAFDQPNKYLRFGGSAGAVSVALTGVLGTSGLGSLVSLFSLAPSGVAGTGSPGSFTPGLTGALSGNTGTGGVGSGTAAFTLGLTGTGATADVGATGAVLGALPTGVGAAGALGTLLPSITVGATGVSAAGAVGTIIGQQSWSADLTGVSATGGLGSLAPLLGISVTGVSATGVVGTLTSSGGVPAVVLPEIGEPIFIRVVMSDLLVTLLPPPPVVARTEPLETTIRSAPDLIVLTEV